jgi:hypothetical protein
MYAHQNYPSLVRIPAGTRREGGHLNGENPGDSWGELAAFLDFSCLHSLSHCRILYLEKSRISGKKIVLTWTKGLRWVALEAVQNYLMLY